jgi:hypothetical protein
MLDLSSFRPLFNLDSSLDSSSNSYAIPTLILCKVSPCLLRRSSATAHWLRCAEVVLSTGPTSIRASVAHPHAHPTMPKSPPKGNWLQRALLCLDLALVWRGSVTSSSQPGPPLSALCSLLPVWGSTGASHLWIDCWARSPDASGFLVAEGRVVGWDVAVSNRISKLTGWLLLRCAVLQTLFTLFLFLFLFNFPPLCRWLLHPFNA